MVKSLWAYYEPAFELDERWINAHPMWNRQLYPVPGRRLGPSDDFPPEIYLTEQVPALLDIVMIWSKWFFVSGKLKKILESFAPNTADYRRAKIYQCGNQAKTWSAWPIDCDYYFLQLTNTVDCLDSVRSKFRELKIKKTDAIHRILIRSVVFREKVRGEHLFVIQDHGRGPMVSDEVFDACKTANCVRLGFKDVASW